MRPEDQQRPLESVFYKVQEDQLNNLELPPGASPADRRHIYGKWASEEDVAAIVAEDLTFSLLFSPSIRNPFFT